MKDLYYWDWFKQEKAMNLNIITESTAFSQ